MFEFLKPKITPDIASNECVKLINSARILPHYKNGNYEAFMVIVNCKAHNLRRYLAHNAARAALVSAVEKRVMIEKRFEDRFEDETNERVLIYRKDYKLVPNMIAERIIVAIEEPVASIRVDPVDEKTGRNKVHLEIHN
jgi:hypothetical protein